MCSLFNMAILAEWTEIVRPVFQKQPFMLLFFLAFMGFVCFGVMNVIIGMIVDSTMQHARQLERELELSHKGEKVRLLKELKEVIFQVDSSGDSDIDMDELDGLLNSEDARMESLMGKLNLPSGCSAKEFLALLDTDGDGRVRHDEFIQNLYRVVNCSGYQQMCLIQIGVNRLMQTVNVLAGSVQDISEQVRQQPPSLLEKNQKPTFSAPFRPASEGASAAHQPVLLPARPASEKAELAISLDAVCRELSTTVYNRLSEGLTQTLDRLLVAVPEAVRVDDASVVVQWGMSEDRLQKIASADPATLKSLGRAGSKDGARMAWDCPLEDIGKVLDAGNPSTVEAHPFNTPDRSQSRDGKMSYSTMVHDTDAAIDRKPPGRGPHEIS